MNKDIYFGKNNLRFLYYRYKDSAHYTLSIIVFVIVISVLLLFGFILPQAEQWFSIRNEVETTLNRTAVIEDNISYMGTMNRAQLNEGVRTVTTALPIEKNFGDILGAVTASSLRSGVSFQDYAFQVGQIASTSGQVNNGTMQGLSAVTLTLVVNGTVDQLRVFLREVQKTVPLSQITSIDGSTGSITVTMEFYQKGLPAKTLKDDQPIPRVLETSAAQLNELSSMQSARQSPIVPTGGSSGGSVPLF